MFSAFAFGGLALVAPGAGLASVHRYVDWTSVDPGNGTATGTLTLPDASKVTVRFSARNADGSPGQIFGAQVDEGGTNYWQPAAPYISAEVENAPPGSDIVQLAGSDDQVYELTLSAPLEDPVLAIVSLGASGIVTTYHFGAPFAIVSQGVGALGGSDQALARLPGNVLEGAEGHGTIRFTGTFTTLSWTVPTPEVWHGFTLGVRTGNRPADASGAPDAADGGAPDVAVGPAEVDPPAGGAGGRSATAGAGGEPGRVDAAPSGEASAAGGCSVTGPGSRKGSGGWLVAGLAALAGLLRRRRD